MDEYGIPGSSFSTPAGNNYHDYVNKKSSTSSAFIINNMNTNVEDQYLVEDLEIEPSASLLELLVDALLLLSDASLFKCYTRNTIPHLELHLRTWIATLEVVFYSPTVLTHETRDKLYSNLDKFIDIHYRVTEMFSQGVNHSFKSKFKPKEINITSNIYMHFPNYNINFLLIHLRDTLHTLITGASKIPSVTYGNVPTAFDFTNNTLPRIINAFNVKYPIAYWYPIWHELLLMHYSLKTLIKDLNYNILRFYNETYLLKSLWQHAFNQGYEQQKHVDILTILNNYKAFRGLWTRKEPTALPNSLWFDVIHEEIEKFVKLLPVDFQLKFKNLIYDINQKLQLSNEFIEQFNINYEKKSIIKNNILDKTSNSLLEIIAENFTCKITKQITGDFLILSCCGHSVSRDAINKWKNISIFKNKLFECPFCRTEIKMESFYNLAQNTMVKGLYKRLEQEGYLNNLLEKQQMPTNNKYMAEDDLLLKMNKMHIFGIRMSSKSPISVLKKVRPKVLHPAATKATKAEQQKDYETAIVWLTQLLQNYPKSYSILCRRAFASLKLKLYFQALKDLSIAIQLKPSKSLAYNYK
ncbi:165_t:CDS:2, partial [Cetraspora pellucida]